MHRAMAQPPVRDYLPASWTNLARVKAEHFCALAHYHAAMALCESSCECGTPHARVYPQRFPAQAHGLSEPQQQPRVNSQGRRTSSSPQLPVSPKVPHCRSTQKSAGSLVRHHRQGPGLNIAQPPSSSATLIPELAGTDKSRVVERGRQGHNWGNSSFFPCSTVWPGRTFLVWPTLSDPVAHSTF